MNAWSVSGAALYAASSSDGHAASLRRQDAHGLSQDFQEMLPEPSAPDPNMVRLFARDNGSGKTQLCVRFATGAVQVIATELSPATPAVRHSRYRWPRCHLTRSEK